MLYIYNLDALSPKDQEALLVAADRSGEAVCYLETADLEKTVAECLADGRAPLALHAFQPLAQKNGAPFLLMDVDDLALDPLLATLRQHGVRIGHKCMVTDKNKGWTLQKLIGDVVEEHQLMTALQALSQLLSAAEDFKEKDYDPLLWLTFVQKKRAAADLLAHVGKAPISLEAITETTKALNQAVLALIRARGAKA